MNDATKSRRFTANTGDAKAIRAAIVMRASQSDALWEVLDENIQDYGPISPISHINGIYKRSVSYDDVAEDAMYGEDLIRTADFFYIEPFLNGREAGLKPRGAHPINIMSFATVLALALIAIDGIKLLLRRRFA